MESSCYWSLYYISESAFQISPQTNFLLVFLECAVIWVLIDAVHFN